MKKMNLLVMSLVSAAALSFTSCSSNEELDDNNAGQAKADGFYMTLTVQSPNVSGTRTSVLDPTENATTDEAAIKTGTLYLVDANGDIAFQEDLSGLDWSGAVGEGESATQKDGQKTFKIEVKNVHADNTYKVYFKAGDQDPTEAMNFKPTLSNIFKTTDKFATPFAEAENFAMFNQNDTQVDGNAYTVTFIKANNNEANPAKVKYNGEVAPIKVERVVARIDAPVNKSTKLFAKYPENASDALKVAIDDAKDKVANIELVDYAVANLANQSYVMQTWSENQLSLPANTDYTQKATDFGTKYYYKDNEFFNNNTVNYVFENNSSENPTTMYFEYKVTLKNEKFEGDADFKDDATNAGTFYRYNNVIYTSFDQIFKDYKDVATTLFGGGKTAATMKEELSNAINDEAKLAKFREDYKIEVFKGGKTYYKQVIKDNHIGYANAIQRNSIYRLTVNNIFNVGAQVPNGEPTDENKFYFLDVTVTVNPWVLNTQDVDLQ